MKKLARTNPVKKYNKLFKFLAFDLSFRACIIMSIIIILYMIAIAQLFALLQIKQGNSNIIS